MAVALTVHIQHGQDEAGQNGQDAGHLHRLMIREPIECHSTKSRDEDSGREDYQPAEDHEELDREGVKDDGRISETAILTKCRMTTVETDFVEEEVDVKGSEEFVDELVVSPVELVNEALELPDEVVLVVTGMPLGAEPSYALVRSSAMF